MPAQPVKKCLLIRAMLPEKFPKAYGSLIDTLALSADTGKGCRLIPCRCKPVKCGSFPDNLNYRGGLG